MHFQDHVATSLRQTLNKNKETRKSINKTTACIRNGHFHEFPPLFVKLILYGEKLWLWKKKFCHAEFI